MNEASEPQKDEAKDNFRPIYTASGNNIKSDLPTDGGAAHTYSIEWKRKGGWFEHHLIVFQHGPRKEVGSNGLTEEDLLLIVEDRLQCFQQSEYACAENAEALIHLDKALDALTRRTLRRAKEGTEGTSAL